MKTKSTSRSGQRPRTLAVLRAALSILTAAGALWPVPTAAQLNGLVGYWRFEEGAGGTTADASTNGLFGAMVGPLEWVPGAFGSNALSFGGSAAVGERVEMGNSPLLQLTGAMTLSAWVSVDNLNVSGTIVGKSGWATADRGWSLAYVSGGSWAVEVAVDAATVVTLQATGAEANLWTHVAGVYKPGVPVLRLYVNGALVGELSDGVPTNQFNGSISAIIGARANNGNYFNGIIDEVRVFNRALSETELRALPEVIPTPLTFVTQPVSRVVAQSRPVTFTAAVRGSVPHFYQWFMNGAAIPGANGPTYTIPAVSLDMSGTAFSVLASNLAYNVTSTNAVLTVSSDTTAPALVSAGSANGNSVGVCFNEPMDQNLFWDPSHFTVNGGAASIAWTQPRADGQSAVIYLNAPISGSFSVQVSGVTDVVGNPVAPGSTANGTVAGLAAADLGFPAYPGETYACRFGDYEITASGADIWGTSDHGHFASRQLSGDFDVRVQVAGLTPVNNTAKAGLMVRQTLDTDSPTLHLLANPPPPAGRGYIEAGLRTAAGGNTAAWGTFTGAVMPDVWMRLRRWGDHFTAFRSTNGMDWVLVGQTSVTLTNPVHLGLAASAHSNTTEPTLARFEDFGNIVFTNVTLAITQPPTNSSVEQSTTAVFQVQADGTGAPASELGYQWQRGDGAGGFTNLPNAIGTSYSFTVRAGDDGARFRVRVYFAGLSENSAAATLTVTPDVTPPAIQSVTTAGVTTRIRIMFSEAVQAGSATLTSNYGVAEQVSGTPLNILGAALSADGRTVTLDTDPMSEGPVYVLTVNGVQDVAVPANSITANTRASFTYSALLAYYQFEEGTGTATSDSSGNGLNGNLYENTTIGNGPAWVPGLFGQYALNFDGANDRVDLGNPTDLRLTGPMTVAAWVWVDTISGSGRIVTKGGGSGARGWALNVESTDVWALQIATNNNTLVTVSGGPVIRNEWVHVAGVYDPGAAVPAMRLYTNGVLVAEKTDGVSTTQFNTSLAVTIGSRVSATRFDGKIDEVRIYTRPLTGVEIAALAQPPTGPPEFLPPTISGGQIHLNWTGTGTLEWAPSILGPWTPISPAPTPPYSEAVVTSLNRFYRIATP